MFIKPIRAGISLTAEVISLPVALKDNKTIRGKTAAVIEIMSPPRLF
jgi:hypothetical protein